MPWVRIVGKLHCLLLSPFLCTFVTTVFWGHLHRWQAQHEGHPVLPQHRLLRALWARDVDEMGGAGLPEILLCFLDDSRLLHRGGECSLLGSFSWLFLHFLLPACCLYSQRCTIYIISNPSVTATTVWTPFNLIVLSGCPVQISVVSLAAESLGADQITSFRALRTLRALRPLRAISRWQGMKVSDL